MKKKLINLANSENTDETAHKEPSHLDFHCLQMHVRIYLMSEVTYFYHILCTSNLAEIIHYCKTACHIFLYTIIYLKVLPCCQPILILLPDWLFMHFFN